MRMLRGRFGRGAIRIFDCHAKVYALTGGAFPMVMVSSANFTNNPRVEVSVISTDPEVVAFHREWMGAVWAGADPFESEIILETETMPERTLFLVRGLPGSGKSSLGKVLAPEANVAADDYLYDDAGIYRATSARMSSAHKKCQEEAARLMSTGAPKVAVHNTFSRSWEAEPYYQLAEAAGYSVFVIECQNDYGNIHDVPPDAIKAMRIRWEDLQ